MARGAPAGVLRLAVAVDAQGRRDARLSSPWEGKIATEMADVDVGGTTSSLHGGAAPTSGANAVGISGESSAVGGRRGEREEVEGVGCFFD